MIAYAVQIKPENFGAIASEKPDFDLESTKKWLDFHEEGYFLRDPESALDCKYFESTVFSQMYTFSHPNSTELFKRVVRI